MMRVLKRQYLYFLSDLALMTLSFFVCFFIRFEGRLPEHFFHKYAIYIFPLIFFKIVLFLGVNLYKKVWRYANLRELVTIIQGVTISTVIFIGYVYFLRIPFPRSVIVLDWMLSIFLIGGSRLIKRLLGEFRGTVVEVADARNVLIIGAGDAGEMVLREYRKHHKEFKTRIVGFIDDDPSKWEMEIHGVPVLGNREKIPSVVARYNVEEIIIAIPSAASKEVRGIHKLCLQSNVKVRILPGVYEIINGDVSLSQIREVQVEDLLGREPVRLDMEEIAISLRHKTVLITGGGGSIGSELCRQVCKFEPEKLLIFDIYENTVYDLELELREKFPHLNIYPVIGSIRDISRLRQVFQKYKPDVVFHAAAHKHVPMMEYNPEEAVKNNVFGTRNVAIAADEAGVERFVMISTDKAVNPTNIMGATKRVAEMIIQDLNKHSKTKFVAVRFGNVLGSRGSVIPIFQKQIAQGGPITVTHHDITRYFMTIPEACQLVLQASTLGKGGEVFVLDMGKPVKIMDLARDLIELSGLKVDEDIEIKITGLRPGEKLYEELLSDKENTLATQHERIMIARLDDVDSGLLNQSLDQLEEMVESSFPHYLVRTLVKLVATYTPSDLQESAMSMEQDAI